MNTLFSDEKLKEIKELAEHHYRADNLTDSYFRELTLNLLAEIPKVIDELLELREKKYCEFDEVSENEADTINIYEQEVHITNNYTTNFLDKEEIEDMIDYKLHTQWLQSMTLNWGKNE